MGRKMGSFPDKYSQILTFLYTDIEGSTRLWEQRPNSAEKIILRHNAILKDAVETYGGTIFRTVGDGICAVFSNASNAVAAALKAQLDIHAEDWSETGLLKVRMTIHTGEVEEQGNDYSGSSLNRIARILSVTYGEQILISQAVQLLVRDGLPPGVELLDLGEVRLRDLSLPEHLFQLVHPDLPSDFPPPPSLNHRPNNLPTQVTALIGRETTLADILSRLKSDKVRMLTLTGPGGTGKTRLGLQTAAEMIEHFDNGVFFIDLAPIYETGRVLSEIAHVLGIRETGNRSVLEELIEQLQAKQMLLLLDNMEQVTAAGPQLVEILLACPKLKMLVTSREPLNVRVEQIFPVPPLNLPVLGGKIPPLEKITQNDAVRLFVERAQAVKPDFQLNDENALAVAEICVRLDGLPLAIELAASRIRLFTPQALLERLGNRLSFLKGGARDLPARQQTLRDTIGWSYELLNPSGQRLFELLSVFHGGASLEAIEAVAGQVGQLKETGEDTFDLLSSLVDKSLVRQVEDINGNPRFIMLETIREYSAEKLVNKNEFYNEARRAFAAHFANFAKQQWELFQTDQAAQALAQIEAEIENLNAAWSCWVAEGDLEQLSKFIDSLWLFYNTRSWYRALIKLTNDLLHVLSTTPSTPERAQQEIILNTSLASALLVTKGYVSEEVEQAYNRARHLIEELGEVPQLFPILRGLARYYTYRAEFDKALETGKQILALAEELQDPDIYVVGHLVLGTGYAFSDSLSGGMEHLEKGIANYFPERTSSHQYKFGTEAGVACLNTSALLLWMMGFPEKAIKRAAETVVVTEKLNQPFSRAYSVFHTGLLHLWRREAEPAEIYARKLLELTEDSDMYIWNAVGSCLLGAAMVMLGQEEQGLEQIQSGMETYQGLISPPIFWSLLVYTQAASHLSAGKPEEGLPQLVETMDSADMRREGALGAEFCRLRGELLLAISPENQEEAEAWLQRALDIARTHQARMLTLRAALSLCRLWQEQGRIKKSRDLLRQAYEELTEGFSLADLEDARIMLEELPDTND
jgi:predicted ATPase/class 3 adenylate cyclase